LLARGVRFAGGWGRECRPPRGKARTQCRSCPVYPSLLLVLVTPPVLRCCQIGTQQRAQKPLGSLLRLCTPRSRWRLPPWTRTCRVRRTSPARGAAGGPAHEYPGSATVTHQGSRTSNRVPNRPRSAHGNKHIHPSRATSHGVWHCLRCHTRGPSRPLVQRSRTGWSCTPSAVGRGEGGRQRAQGCNEAPVTGR
jgi:hypothetical protein